MNSKYILLGVSVLMALLDSGRVLACGCKKPRPPCKAYGEASVVFIGTVKGVTEGARKRKPNGEINFESRLFKFSVEETFSGTPTKESEVATGLSADDCGYPFVKGASYLIYAYRDEKDGRGNFEVTGLKPGTLKLKLHLSDELTTYISERVLKFDSAGCASEVFYVVDNGRISGRVLDAEGNPVSGLGVVILPLTGWAINWYAKTDEEGRYKASSIPAGEYMVGINVRGQPRSIEPAELPRGFLCPNCLIIVENLVADEQAAAYPRLFYPGVFQTAKAERLLITLKYGLRANAQGEFSFKAYRGGRYIVEADYSTDKARQVLMVAEPRTVIVMKPEESITLIVRT